MYETINRTLTCTDCNIQILVKSNIQRGFSDHENVYCPKCNKNLGEIRADMGFEIVDIKELKK